MAPGGSLSAGAFFPTALTFTNGQASYPTFFCAVAGYVTITVTDNIAPIKSNPAGNITVNPGAATSLLMLLGGQTFTPGNLSWVTPLVPTLQEGVYYSLTVYAVDGCNNVDTTYNNLVTLATDDTVIANPATPAATVAVNGKALYSVMLNMGGSGGHYVITSSSGALPQGKRNVYVNQISMAYLHLTVPSQITAGSNFALTATVSYSPDQLSPVSTGVSGAFRLTATAADATPLLGNIGGYANPFSLGNGTGTYSGWFKFDRAGSVFFNTSQVTSNIPVDGIRSAAVIVQPDWPHHIAVTVSSDVVQAPKTANINVTVFDQFNNPTVSSLYPVEVFFERISGSGALSVSRTPTDAFGLAACVFESASQNEDVLIRVSVRNSLSGYVYAGNDKVFHVTVAPPSAGSIVIYPNPFNPLRQTTAVNYYLQSQSNIEINIYDAFGRQVIYKKFDPASTDQTAVAATRSGGAYWVWDGRNGEGTMVGDGIYLLKVKARGSSGEQTFTRRVGVLK